MKETNIPADSGQPAEQPGKKIWHGALFGFGCGIVTILPSFVCLSAIGIAYAMINAEALFSAVEKMSGDEMLQNLTGALVLIIGGSVVVSILAGILSGRYIYQRSAGADANRRLITVIAAGLGLGLLFFIIGLCVGIALEGPLLTVIPLVDSTFMLYVVFPAVPGILASFVGAVLGTFLAFRRSLPKDG